MAYHRLIPVSGNAAFFDAGTGLIYLIEGTAGHYCLRQDAFGGPRDLGYRSSAPNRQQALNELLERYAADLERVGS
jgi:hypothetical protein